MIAPAPMPAFTYRPVLGRCARALSTNYRRSTPRTTRRTALTCRRRTDCSPGWGAWRIRRVRLWDGESHKRTLFRGCASAQCLPGPRLSVGITPSHGTGHPLTPTPPRSEEHTSELQSQSNLVCRLLLEKKNHTGHDPLQA